MNTVAPAAVSPAMTTCTTWQITGERGDTPCKGDAPAAYVLRLGFGGTYGVCEACAADVRDTDPDAEMRTLDESDVPDIDRTCEENRREMDRTGIIGGLARAR